VASHRNLSGLRSFVSAASRYEGAAELGPALRVATGALLQRSYGLDHDILALRDRAHLLAGRR